MSTNSNWLKENRTSIFFLIGQVLVFGVYIVRLETRVHTLEVRGSPHLEAINTRLTTTEKETEANNKRIVKIVEIMTRNLHISPDKDDDEK